MSRSLKSNIPVISALTRRNGYLTDLNPSSSKGATRVGQCATIRPSGSDKTPSGHKTLRISPYSTSVRSTIEPKASEG